MGIYKFSNLSRILFLKSIAYSTSWATKPLNSEQDGRQAEQEYKGNLVILIYNVVSNNLYMYSWMLSAYQLGQDKLFH